MELNEVKINYIKSQCFNTAEVVLVDEPANPKFHSKKVMEQISVVWNESDQHKKQSCTWITYKSINTNKMSKFK